ncbi:MAG: hypothetical protein WCO60_16815 [Verrucomicrobiota bacterium]
MINLNGQFLLKENTYQKLRDNYNTLPHQGIVGRSASSYLLYGKSSLPLDNKVNLVHALSREVVKGICIDPNVPVKIAYAVAMAWGGQRYDHFASSANSPVLHGLLEYLRTSQNSRRVDFERAKEDASKIKGLGISFFTKLLYFFRPSSDAYILDQWTAKALDALLVESPVNVTAVGLPDPKTTGLQYEKFCEVIDLIALQLRNDTNLAWTGEITEVAIFDRPNGKWRGYLKSVWNVDGAKRSGEMKRGDCMPAIADDNSLFLCQNRMPDGMGIREMHDPNNGRARNNAFICNRHGCIDFKRPEAPGIDRDLLEELKTPDGQWRELSSGIPYASKGATHCTGGTGYVCGIDFGSIDNAIRYLKTFFSIVACPVCDPDPVASQKWIDSL